MKINYFSIFIFIQVYLQHSIAQQHNLTGKLNYFNFISERLIHHYTYHCDEKPPMLAASEFMHSLNRNRFFYKNKSTKRQFYTA